MPKSTQEMQPNLKNVKVRQDLSLGLCAGNGVRCFISTIETIISSYPMWCAEVRKWCAGCKVMP